MPHVFIITSQLIPETNIWSSLAPWRTGVGGVVTPTLPLLLSECFSHRFTPISRTALKKDIKSYSCSLKQHVKARSFCLDSGWVLHRSMAHTMLGVMFALLYQYIIYLWEDTPLLFPFLDVQCGTAPHHHTHKDPFVLPRGTTRAQRFPPPPPAALATVFSNSSQLNSQTYEKRNSNNSSLRCCGLLSLYLQTRRSHVGYWQLSSGAEYFSLARSRTAAC